MYFQFTSFVYEESFNGFSITLLIIKIAFLSNYLQNAYSSIVDFHLL